MKCISLWQPWASAIAAGSKRVETRSWATGYRGPLLIHAAKRCSRDELIHLQCCWNWCGALHPLGVRMGGGTYLDRLLPFGAIVAVCDLVDCRPTGSFTGDEIDAPRQPAGIDAAHLYQWTERQMGDFSRGRFGWVLENVRALPRPVPYRGAQGLFDVPAAALEAA